MSTKMSSDLNITRPTSRVIKTPGGGSTFSIAGGSTEEPLPQKGGRHIQGGSTFSIAEGSTDSLNSTGRPAKKQVASNVPSQLSLGNEETATAAAAPVPVSIVADTAVVALEEIKLEEYTASAPLGKVLVLVGGALGVDSLVAAVSRALLAEGLLGGELVVVNDVSIMAFAAQKLVKSYDVIIATAIVSDPTNSVVPALYTAFTHIAVHAGKVIIPAIVASTNLSEAKVLLPSLAASWAGAASTVLRITDDESFLQVVSLPEPGPIEELYAGSLSEQLTDGLSYDITDSGPKLVELLTETTQAASSTAVASTPSKAIPVVTNRRFGAAGGASSIQFG